MPRKAAVATTKTEKPRRSRKKSVAETVAAKPADKKTAPARRRGRVPNSFAGYPHDARVTPIAKPDSSPYRAGVARDVAYRGLTARKMTVAEAREVCGSDKWHLLHAVETGAISIK